MSAFSLFSRKKTPKLQWTNRLARLVDDPQPNSSTNTSTTSATHHHLKSTADSGPSEKGTSQPTVDVPLRLEGPYFTPVDPARHHTVICFVAGTGVSGAIAIANAFTELERERATQQKVPGDTSVDGTLHAFEGLPTRIWRRCIVVWSVREEDYVDLPFLQGTTSLNPVTTNVSYS